jgi:hypothetical protein
MYCLQGARREARPTKKALKFVKPPLQMHELDYKFRSQFKKEFRTALHKGGDPPDLFAEVWDSLVEKMPLSETQFRELLPELIRWTKRQKRRSPPLSTLSLEQIRPEDTKRFG